MRVWISCLLGLTVATGCAPSRQELISSAALECPSVGINTERPDFSMTFKAETVDSYYNCLIGKLTPSDTPKIGMPGSLARHMVNGEDEQKELILPNLQYQQVLWRQVLAGERKPNSAQEAWIVWSTQLTQLERANAAAITQAAATRAQANAIDQTRSRSTSMHCTGMNMGGGMTSVNCN